MIKRSFLAIILFVFLFLTSGCTLVKGIGGACVGAAGGAAEGFKEGFKEDVSFFKKSDSWVKDNLW